MQNFCTKYCNTLQHTATHCNTLQHTATHCNSLPHTATHYTATHRNTPLTHHSIICVHSIFFVLVWLDKLGGYIYNTVQRTATRCNTLQRTAIHCNTLQHTATHRYTGWVWVTLITRYNTPQHTATHCNTLQHIDIPGEHGFHSQHAAAHCNTLQHLHMLDGQGYYSQINTTYQNSKPKTTFCMHNSFILVCFFPADMLGG